DPSAVNAPADIYGLGATLFGLLTGQPPYPPAGSIGEALRALQREPPRKLRELRPDAPAELEALIDRMLDRDPTRRPAMPLAVMTALLPFTPPPAGGGDLAGAVEAAQPGGASAAPDPGAGRRVLIVDDELSVRTICRITLAGLGHQCVEAANGRAALDALREEPFDLVLLDLNLPDMSGYEICRQLRQR